MNKARFTNAPDVSEVDVGQSLRGGFEISRTATSLVWYKNPEVSVPTR